MKTAWECVRYIYVLWRERERERERELSPLSSPPCQQRVCNLLSSVLVCVLWKKQMQESQRGAKDSDLLQDNVEVWFSSLFNGWPVSLWKFHAPESAVDKQGIIQSSTIMVRLIMMVRANSEKFVSVWMIYSIKKLLLFVSTYQVRTLSTHLDLLHYSTYLNKCEYYHN